MSNTTTPDYTTQLDTIAEQLTIIANYLTSLKSTGLDPTLSRALTVNALKNSGQLNNVVNEMNNPTTLPGGA